jgi:hypothetical protein
MNIPMQIDINSIARATNAAHYEYLTTVRKRTEEIRLDEQGPNNFNFHFSI